MSPRKKKTNLAAANMKNSEWIPGSEMVFEVPDVNLISRSRRATKRFKRSLQNIEKEEFQDIISPPGVKTRLRRQSLIVNKSIPNVSFSVTNSSVSICVPETNSTKSGRGKRLSSSKVATRTSSDSVLKNSSSKTDPLLVTETMKSFKKKTAMEKSLETNQVVDKAKTTNLLDTDEIIAIIDNLHDNRKRKSDVSLVDPDEKSKHIKFGIQHLETNTDRRRSPRIAKMKRNKTLKEEDYLKEKTLNKSLQKNQRKAEDLENSESLINNRAEKYAEENVKEVNQETSNTGEKKTPQRKRTPVKKNKEVEPEVNQETSNTVEKKTPQRKKTPVKKNKEVEPEVNQETSNTGEKKTPKRKNTPIKKNKEVEPEVNQETSNTGEKKTPNRKRTPVKKNKEVEPEVNQETSNTGEKKTPNRKRTPVKKNKEVEPEVNQETSNTVEKKTPKRKKTPIKKNKEVEPEVNQETSNTVEKKTPKRKKTPVKKNKVELEVNQETSNTGEKKTPKRKISPAKKNKVEPEVKESPTRIRTPRKRKSMRNTKVDLGKEEGDLVEITPMKVTPTINIIEEKNKTEKVSEKSVVTLTTDSRAEKLTSKKVISEEEENVTKIADKHESVASQKSDADKEESTENSIKPGQDEEKEIVDETTARRVTRQMTSTEQIQFVSGGKKRLQKGKKKSPSKTIGGTEFDLQIVNTCPLSAKSRKTKRCIANRKSQTTSSSLHRATTPSKISPNTSPKRSKKFPRKPTPTRGVSYKNISEKKTVADDNDSIPFKKTKVTDISAKIDVENKPQESVSSTRSWSLKNLFKSFGKPSSQCEVLPKDGEEEEASRLANENVSISTEISTDRMKQKVPSERTGLFSVPLLSSTPDVAKQPQVDAKTSFASRLHKTVSNFSPFSFHKSFEYTRTSIASANNQTIEESVLLQKVEHCKVNNEKNTIEDDETQMNTDAGIKKIEESSLVLLDNQIQFECPESSELEIDKKAITNDDISTSDCIDVGFNASVPSKSVYYESQQSDEEMPTMEKNVHYESQSGDELVVDVNEGEYESHFSDKEDLLAAATKSIHYESQQSEIEDVTPMSRDTEEILKDMSYEAEEVNNVSQKSNEEAQNILSEQEDLLALTKSMHYESQQSETEDETNMSQDDPEEIIKDMTYEADEVNNVSQKPNEEAQNMLSKQEYLLALTKSMHYESQQSETEDETNMSQDDPEEIIKDRSYEADEVNNVSQKPNEEAQNMLSEQEYLLALTKSIHYESQQSETEDETNMSQDDPEEIIKDMTYEAEEGNNVFQKPNEEAQNMPEQENMFFDSMKFHSDSQQSEIEDCDIVSKKLHYESQQSDILASEIENECEISKKEEEEKLDDDNDVEFDYDASYSNYGLRCIIL